LNMASTAFHLSIREANEVDIPIIRELAHAIWPVVYREMISSDQINYMLELMYAHDALLVQMHSEGCTFLIAESDNVACGFTSFSEVAKSRFKLHKLYVEPGLHRSGLGKKLLEDVLRRASERGGKTIELQVNKQNPAKDFYLHMGFETKQEIVVDIGGGFVMDDYVMLKRI
jgi:ribosomal protein S18 acetylase RimI-like enzyme